MAEWVWARLAQGADWPDHPFHLLTMATVSPDGRPAARIMTNRGAERVTGRMWFYSRLDTPKIADLRGHQWVCLVGYDPQGGVQLRIAGTAVLHQHDDLANEHWQHIADVSHWLFNLTEAESAAAVGNDPRLPHDHDLLAKGLTAKSRAQFGVLEVMVETIDWHQTNGSQQRRAVMHAKDQWRATLVE
jgi:general stress protein 26